MRLFVGGHHSRDMVPIIVATQAALTGRWVVGASQIITHAFVVVEAGGLAWRLDGQPPHSEWSPCDLATFAKPTALWEITDHVDTAAGVAAAREIDQAPYDWLEIRRQIDAAVIGLVPPLARLLPRGWATMDLLSCCHICTRVALLTLEACGGLARLCARERRTLFPEELCGALRDSEGEPWLRRARVTGDDGNGGQ